MAYSIQTWLEGEAGGTPLSPARLNHMENGILDAAADADSALAALAALNKGSVGLDNVLNIAQQPASAKLTELAALASTDGTLPYHASGVWSSRTTAQLKTLLGLDAAMLGTLADAKGDLLVASAADTPARLAVGANRRFLRADSAASLGVRWGEADVMGPEDHNYLAWTGDPGMSTTGSLLSSTSGGGAGVLVLNKIKVPVDCTVSNIVMYLTAPGATLTSGQCFAALFNSAGTWLKSTSDRAAQWVEAAGEKAMPLTSSQALSAGDAYVGLFYNGTTSPTFARFGNTASNLTNAGTSGQNRRAAVADTGRTISMPGTIGTMTATNITWFIALS